MKTQIIFFNICCDYLTALCPALRWGGTKRRWRRCWSAAQRQPVHLPELRLQLQGQHSTLRSRQAHRSRPNRRRGQAFLIFFLFLNLKIIDLYSVYVFLYVNFIIGSPKLLTLAYRISYCWCTVSLFEDFFYSMFYCFWSVRFGYSLLLLPPYVYFFTFLQKKKFIYCFILIFEWPLEKSILSSLSVVRPWLH